MLARGHIFGKNRLRVDIDTQHRKVSNLFGEFNETKNTLPIRRVVFSSSTIKATCLYKFDKTFSVFRLFGAASISTPYFNESIQISRDIIVLA